MAEEKKQKKRKKTSKKYTLYESSKPIKRKNKFCPKCGPGVFLSNHANRVNCGTCGYMETKEVKK